MREVEKDIPSRENTVGKGSEYQNNMVRSWDTKQLALTPWQLLFREWQVSGLERKVRTGLQNVSCAGRTSLDFVVSVKRHALSQQAHSVLCHYSLTCFKRVVLLLAFILLLDTEHGCGRQVGKQCYLPHSSFLFFSHI